jgi:hypothetical protein
MKLGKILLGGVAVMVFKMGVGRVTCGGFFGWVYKLEPINVWKPMEGAPGVKFLVGSLVLSVVFAAVYALIQKGIPGGNKLVKGLVYGLCIWAVGMLPGMLATAAFMTVARTVVIYWTVLGLVQLPLEGLIVSALYGE